MTCPNPHCARGVEPVIVNTESRVALFVRALVNPSRPPRILTMVAPCAACKPEERAAWDEKLARRIR